MDRGDRQARPVRRLKHVDSGVDLGVRAMDMGFSIVGCLYRLRSSSLCFCFSGSHLFNIFPYPSTISSCSSWFSVCSFHSASFVSSIFPFGY